MNKDYYQIDFYWDSIDKEWIADFSFQDLEEETINIRCQSTDPVSCLDTLSDTLDSILNGDVDVNLEEEDYTDE